MEIHITLLVLLISLVTIFVIVNSKASKILIGEMGNFGPADKGNIITNKAKEKIVEHILKLKTVAFYGYWSSIGICFLISIVAFWFYYIEGLNSKIIPEIIALGGGIKLTASFNRLYKKCTEDLRLLLKKIK